MDNITHSLAGLALAEGAVAWAGRGKPLPNASAAFRPAAILISILANNFPDIDFVYSSISGPTLGYLLHHRGHTHTFSVGLLTSALLATLTLAWIRARRVKLSPRELTFVLCLALAGPALHVGLDSLNNYGVHPFWPFDNRWYYGDTLFIIEPLFMLALAVPLIGSMQSRLAKGLLATPCLVVIGLCWWVPFVPRLTALAVLVFGLLVWWATSGLSRGPRARVALGLSLLLILMFQTGSRAVKAQVSAALSEPLSLGIEDVIATPHPANPLCYEVLVVARSREDYVLVHAGVATLPNWLGPESCPKLRGGGTLNFQATNVRTQNLVVHGLFRTPLSAFKERLSSHCVARAFLRFARAPFLLEQPRGVFLLGDARYDREEGLGFAELFLNPESPDCPSFVPPWEPPVRMLQP